jgi:hypothetical protein
MELTRAQLLARIRLLEELAEAREIVAHLPATLCDKRPVMVEIRRIGRYGVHHWQRIFLR